MAATGARAHCASNKSPQHPDSAAYIWGHPGAARDRGAFLQLGRAEPFRREKPVKTMLYASIVLACAGALAAEKVNPPELAPTVGPVQIPYSSLHRVLVRGATGFLQYSYASSTATPTMPLAAIGPGWNTVPAMISIDQTNVLYQPDPTDPSSQIV